MAEEGHERLISEEKVDIQKQNHYLNFTFSYPAIVD